ncbi:unnamed protein product [Closterium sp. NIES-54]
MDRTGKPARLRRHRNGFETLSGNSSVLSDSSVRSPNDTLLTESVTVTAAYDANRAASSNGDLEVKEDCEGLLTGQEEIVHYDLGGCYPCLSLQQHWRPLEIREQATRALTCFGVNDNGALCASAGESERENEEEEAREEGREGASESGRDDMSDLDSAEGAGEAEWAEEAEEAEWAEGAGRAERNASGDGGYGFRGWEYEAEMAMLAESMAEEGIAEGGIAEKGIAEDAKAFRGESWLSSVEWFLSWPLRRLSHPWRKRLLWVWVLVAAAILSLVFATAWQHAEANERDDLESHCDEWGAFIEAKFNITAANTRSISDFIRAYYLDK